MRTFRLATSHDISAVSRLFLGTVRDVLSGFYSAAQVELWSMLGEMPEFWQERIDDCWFLLSFDDEVLSGFCVMQPDGNIEMLYTAADFQGKGVAKSLLELAELEARRRALHWLVADASLSAKIVFERCGFLLVREQETEVCGAPFTNFKMVKDLLEDVS
jgi:putative acetyltransferase